LNQAFNVVLRPAQLGKEAGSAKGQGVSYTLIPFSKQQGRNGDVASRVGQLRPIGGAGFAIGFE
jgi:hypothetical protein